MLIMLASKRKKNDKKKVIKIDNVDKEMVRVEIESWENINTWVWFAYRVRNFV